MKSTSSVSQLTDLVGIIYSIIEANNVYHENVQLNLN